MSQETMAAKPLPKLPKLVTTFHGFDDAKPRESAYLNDRFWGAFILDLDTSAESLSVHCDDGYVYGEAGLCAVDKIFLLTNNANKGLGVSMAGKERRLDGDTTNNTATYMGLGVDMTGKDRRLDYGLDNNHIRSGGATLTPAGYVGPFSALAHSPVPWSAVDAPIPASAYPGRSEGLKRFPSTRKNRQQVVATPAPSKPSPTVPQAFPEPPSSKPEPSKLSPTMLQACPETPVSRIVSSFLDSLVLTPQLMVPASSMKTDWNAQTEVSRDSNTPSNPKPNKDLQQDARSAHVSKPGWPSRNSSVRSRFSRARWAVMYDTGLR